MTFRGHRTLILNLLAGLAALVLTAPAQAQTTALVPLVPGPFTQAQASAGRIQFLVYCTNCHGAYMGGGSTAPALTGDNFREDWLGKSTRDLFRFASTNMPFNAAGTLKQETYLDIVAFILSVNGATPGPTPLTPSSDVRIGTIADGQTVMALLNDTRDFRPAKKRH